MVIRGSGLMTAMTLACLLFHPGAAEAATMARTDRNAIQVTDSFQVVFETDQEVSTRPDFSALRVDFDLLGTSQSTSVNIVNGRMQRSARWTVDLMAKREGVLTVPSIRIGNENSNALTVTVRPATSADGQPAGNIFLEVEVDTETPYVQQQVVLTIRLFRAVQTGSASLSEPNISGGDVVVEQLGDDVGYETQRATSRFAVVERRYALFAQSSGSIVVEPFQFEGRVADNRQSRFDPFARGRIVRARSTAIELNVRPIPADFGRSAWLPAQQLLLVESWPDNAQRFRVGEPVTRTLTLRANGLMSSQLPEVGAGVPDGLRQYPDQPVLENRVADGGLVGIRQEKVALIPSTGGALVLPAVEIPWWNTRTDRIEFARLPERAIEVAPAAAGAGVPDDSAEVAAVDSVTADDPTPKAASPAELSAWPWISLGLGIGWLVTIGAWWSARRRGASAAPQTEKPPGEKQLVAAIDAGCNANDPHAARDALLAWGRAHWPGSRVTSLGELAARLDGEVQQRVHELGRTLYSAAEGPWDGGPFRRAFEAYRSRRMEPQADAEPELEPLYLR